MSKFKALPILNLIESLRENITPTDVQTSFDQIMLVTNMGRSLIDIGKNFIPTDSSPLAMVGRYFILSGIPMSRRKISDKIRNMTPCFVKNLKVSDFLDAVDHRKKNAFNTTNESA